MNGSNLLPIVLILLGGSASSSAAAPAAQATRPSRLTDLKKERLAAAREAVDMTNQYYARGRVSAEVVLECQRRLLAAERDLLDPVKRVESFKRELQLLEENNKLCRNRIVAGMGGNRDLLANEYARTEMEILLAEAAATRPSASASAPLARKRMEIAQQACDLAQTEWRRSEGSLHSVVLWSQRLKEAQLALAANAAERRRALADYLQRARTIEDTAAARYKAGLSSELEHRVGKAHRMEAKALLARAEGKPDQAVRRLDERVQDLKQAVQLCEYLYGRGRMRNAEMAQVRALCSDAEIALLRAKGRTADIPKLRREQLERLKNQEAQTGAKVKAGLATDLDLLTARGDRLDAEILLEESLH